MTGRSWSILTEMEIRLLFRLDETSRTLLSTRTWQCISLAAIAWLAGCGGGQWDVPGADARVLVSVSANGVARQDRPVTITGDFSRPVRVVEVDKNLHLVDSSVAAQADYGSELTFLMKGKTARDQYRFFFVYLGGERPAGGKQMVAATDNAMYQGQKSVVVTTPAATYYYHKHGGGFASLTDPEGNDWISYRPEGGSAGNLRGIPDIIHPQGGFHPGSKACESRLLTAGPLMARIHTRCHDGAWEGEWRIYPGFARFTLQKAPQPYWFLYEGTPGGKLEPDSDYWVTADGTRRSDAEDWQGRLKMPRWVYFGDSALERVLFLVHHIDDGDYDQFWRMEGNMTVFGFGRQLRCCEKSLQRVPAEFTIGFIEATAHDKVKAAVDSAYKNLIVSKGELEKRPH